MSRSSARRLVAVGALACAVAAPKSAGGQQQPVFRGRSDTVRVFTTVIDRDGRLDPTLEQSDFEIRDDGTPQPISLFDKTPQPLRLVVMLDVSGSMQGNLELLRTSSEALFDRLRPDDLTRIGTFGREVKIGGSFTHDRGELLAALPTFIPPDAPTPLWRALDEAMDTFSERTGVSEPRERSGDHGVPASERVGGSGPPSPRSGFGEVSREPAVRRARAEADGAKPPGQDDERRVILVLTDGKDTDSMAFRRKVASQAGVIDRARADDVMIYAVGMRSRPPRQMGPVDLRQAMLGDMPDPGLARVAEETGGGYTEIRLGEDLGAAFARVADELHGQYLLGFAPPKRDGKVHKIDVRVTKPGLKPRARRSYVAPRD